MNMQELLTYVEELTFKTSMFGYDKDEVDIQLDKICDEAEAIILAKEKEIEELKKESKTALGIAAAATGKTMEELEKDTKEDIVAAEEDKEEQETEAEAAEESAPETAYKTADTPEAVTSADEREQARQDAADIIGEARKTAERLLKDAQENKDNAIEEAKKIHEDSLRKVEEEKKQCDELAAQKTAMVNSLKKLTEDTARLMEKMQG